MADENTCVICLESLFNDNCTNLGVSNPCGHPCHVSCFRNWEASRLNGNDFMSGRSRVTCPFCNSSSESFTKIYLSAPTVAYEMDDDDDDDDDDDEDSSVSSLESTSQDAKKGDGKKRSGIETVNETLEEDAPNACANAQPSTPERQFTSKERTDNNVVDLTATPEKTQNESKKKKNRDNLPREEVANSEALGHAKLKQKMKHYRRQFKQCQSRFQECSKKQQELLAKHNEIKERLEDAEKDSENSERNNRHNVLELREQRLENTVLRRELDEAIGKREKAEEKVKQITLQLNKTRKEYSGRLEQIRKSTNVETQRKMMEYPQLLEENKNLKTILQKKKEYWSELRKHVNGFDDDIKARIERSVGVEPADRHDGQDGLLNTKQLRADLKRAQEMTENFNTKRKRDSNEESEGRTKSIKTYPPHVARIARAFQQDKAPKNGDRRNLNALLTELDHTDPGPSVAPAFVARNVSAERAPKSHAQHQRQPSTLQYSQPSAINLSSRSKKKPIATNRRVFSKNSNGFNDIRSCFRST